MSQYALNLVFIGGSFLVYIGIAFWARAGSTSEFYAANRGVHPVLNGMATGADWMSAASFISMAGLIAFVGYDNSTFLMGWTGGYVLLAMLLAPYLRKFGKFTVPEFIGDRFYSSTARMVAVLCLIVASVTYVIGQMTGVGVAFSRFLEVDNTTGLLIGAAVVFFYAVFGGMKGITYTQVAQYVVLIFAYTVPAIFISLQLTGNPLPPLGLFGDVSDGTPLLVKLDQIVTELGFNSYTGHHTNTFNMFLFTLSLMIGTAGLPHVIIRFFTVPRVSDARWSAGWALVFIALLYLVAPAVGAMARLNILQTVYPNGVSEQALEYEARPQWMKNWEITGLLKFEDKNGDGRIQFYNDKAAATPEALAASNPQGNELSVNNDILVLANPEIAKLPGWVIALVAAGGLAAALSTAAGLLLAIASAISHDLIKGAINPNISEKGELLAARISMAVAIDGGLITPVIRDAGSLSLSAIAQAAKALANKAREGKLMPEDYQGGTATISNLGMFGIDEMFPVINPPQALILGIGAGVEQPWKVNGDIALATIMSATGSFDHRAIDGAAAAEFMAAIKEFVENPMKLIS